MNQQTREQINKALAEGQGKTAAELANAALDQWEEDAEAWVALMKSFELLLPVADYDAANELECGENAIRYAAPAKQMQTKFEVYSFYLEKALKTLEYLGQQLADAKEPAGYFQKTFYFDATNAAQRTYEKDKPLIDAVLRSFDYVFALFEAVEPQWLHTHRHLNHLCEKLASQWVKTYSYLEMRYEFYRKRLSDESIRYGLSRYAQILQYTKDAAEQIKKPVPFNLFQWNQQEYLENAEAKLVVQTTETRPAENNAESI